MKARLFIVLAVVVLAAIVLLALHRSAPAGRLRAAFDAEFLTRPDGYQGLTKKYGFHFASTPKQMDPGLMYKALQDGAVDVIDGFATDGRIPAYHLVTLKDDKHFFPPYYAAPLVRAATLKKYPQLAKALDRLAGQISNAEMQKCNYEVDEGDRKASKVAREFLVSKGLLPAGAKPNNGSGGSVVIGGKQFTEQEILGQMMALMIESHTNLKVVRKLNLGGTIVCFNALKAGDLDLYAEYTGTGLVDILKQKVISDPDQAYDAVKRGFLKRYNLVWLKPFGFNNTYTLTMRQDEAQRLGIKTISDLAKYVNGSTTPGSSSAGTSS